MTQCMALIGAFPYRDLPGFIKHKFSQFIYVIVTVSFIFKAKSYFILW